MTPVDIDAVRYDDPAFYAGDPEWAFAQLRATDPVHWYDEGAFWVLTKHADVVGVSRDPQTFRSGGGVLLQDRTRPVDPAQSVLFMDPPEHGRYRKIVSTEFTPRRIAAQEDRIRAITREVLDAIDPSRELDLVEAVTAPIPMLVIAEMLGVPGTDHEKFRVWSDSMMEAATEMSHDSVVHAAELFGYFAEHLTARRERPGDDLLSRLVTAEVDGEQLTEEELVGFCMSLLVAGNETTRNLLSGGLVTLREHPEQLDLLCADPAQIKVAVEELLRWVTPILLFARTATRDVELRGRTIKAGDFVVLQYASANRDEEIFGPQAARLDVTRDPNPHVGFGFGEHFCLGAGLARLEARVVLEEFLARWPSYAVTGPVERPPSNLLRQITRLPVQLGG